jgi:ribosome maturation factor RimP
MQKREEELVKYLVNEKIKELGGFVVEISFGKNKIEIMIDKVNGLTIDDCAILSRHLHSGLEESGILEAYEVEVSSPGTGNAFKVIEQYHKYKGWKVKIITMDGKEITGILEDVEQEEITIKAEITERINKKKMSRVEHTTVLLKDIKETKLVLTIKNN